MSWRALAAAALVAAIVGALLPYVTLALGFGPNVSLLATLLGAGTGALVGARGPGALVAAQAAGVAAGQTAFMCTALAALDLLRSRGALALAPSGLTIFAWLAVAGGLGVLAAIPLRRHFIDEERLPFAAGAAAGEAIVALGHRGSVPRGFGAAIALGGAARALGSPLSPLGVGTGMLIGRRVAGSMGLGALIAVVVPATRATGVAAALLFAGGATRAMIGAPALGRALRLECGDARGLRLVLAIVGVIALCAIDQLALATSIAMTLVSVALAVPLLLVGTRVLGETNWAPVGALAVVAQAALALVAPGCAVVNLIGSTVAAAIPNAAQHTMQSFRAAARVGTCPRAAAVAQLVGVVVGAAMLALTYPLLAAQVGHALPAPLGVAWADAVGAVTGGGAGLDGPAIVIAALAGIALALAETRDPCVPSATGIGIGLIVPGGLAIAVVIGSALGRARGAAPIAAGLVTGDALAATAAVIAS